MLSFRSTTVSDHRRCAGACSPDPGGVDECSQGWSEAQPLVSGVPKPLKPRQGRQNPLPPRPARIAAQALACNGTRQTVQYRKLTENEPHDDHQRTLRRKARGA